MIDFMKYLPFIIPLLIIQLGLLVYPFIDLVRRKKVRFNNKWIWVAVILLGNLLGPIIYLLARGEDE
jgi:hypothetical protein